jgi:hypothetical protein
VPRLSLYVSFSQLVSQPDAPILSALPLLDTGAEYTVLDGNLAIQAGWSEEEIAGRALASFPLRGLRASGGALVGYQHAVALHIPVGRRVAAITLRVLLTAPNVLSTDVLGRGDFFRQVDLALVEAEQRFWLRFRDPTAIRDAW